MTEAEVRALALAVAQTNGHPDPASWAESVVQNWADPATPNPYTAQSAPEAGE